jgi:hypothetical protein
MRFAQIVMILTILATTLLMWLEWQLKTTH